MCTREPCAFQRTENGTRATLSLACCQCPIGCRHAVQQPSWRYSFVPLAREFSSPRLTIRSQPIRQWTSCPDCSSRWSRERGEIAPRFERLKSSRRERSPSTMVSMNWIRLEGTAVYGLCASASLEVANPCTRYV